MVTRTGESFPNPKYPVGGFDIVKDETASDARAYLNNMVFYHYNTTYTFPFASGNQAFITHPQAADGTAGHYLNNVACVGCSFGARVYFRSANPGWNGY